MRELWLVDEAGQRGEVRVPAGGKYAEVRIFTTRRDDCLGGPSSVTHQRRANLHGLRLDQAREKRPVRRLSA
ncbi:MAG: hypothetical protein H0T45_16870, partial [Pyrinomonadaceae bacterium]|nr:hypothetical protein [Pyrinomonadaceae bacterium]